MTHTNHAVGTCRFCHEMLWEGQDQQGTYLENIHGKAHCAWAPGQGPHELEDDNDD